MKYDKIIVIGHIGTGYSMSAMAAHSLIKNSVSVSMMAPIIKEKSTKDSIKQSIAEMKEKDRGIIINNIHPINLFPKALSRSERRKKQRDAKK